MLTAAEQTKQNARIYRKDRNGVSYLVSCAFPDPTDGRIVKERETVFTPFNTLSLEERAKLQLKQKRAVERMASGYNGALWETVLSGKLDYFLSVSTYPGNKFCLQRAKNPSTICFHCYSIQSMNYKKGFAKRLKENSETMNSGIIDVSDLPVINTPFYRFESHGDQASEISVINTLNICDSNPNTSFAVWTKNPFFFDRVFRAGYSKPRNLIIILSSCFVNVPAKVGKYAYFIDGVFTVYTAEYALANNIRINCGRTDCLTCLRCYMHHNGLFTVNEILKSDSRRYYKQLAKRIAAGTAAAL